MMMIMMTYNQSYWVFHSFKQNDNQLKKRPNEGAIKHIRKSSKKGEKKIKENIKSIKQNICLAVTKNKRGSQKFNCRENCEQNASLWVLCDCKIIRKVKWTEAELYHTR